MATTLGWLLGRFLLPNISMVTIGVALGILQWIILQQHLRNARLWIAATTFGWVAGSIFVLTVLPIGLEFLSGAVIGLTTGFVQWLILRREVCWSGWWIVINLIAWTTGMVLVPGLFSTGATAGAITGFTLVLLLRFPKTEYDK